MKLLTGALVAGVIVGAWAQDVRDLAPGPALRREMQPGETHRYRIVASAGEFLHLVVDQKTIDVGLTFEDPSGAKLAARNSVWTAEGPEPVSIIAKSSGVYTLVVEGPKAGGRAKPGAYEIGVREQRPAGGGDQSRVEAEQLNEEGMAVHKKPEAIEKYTRALALYRGAGTGYWEGRTLLLMGDAYVGRRVFAAALDVLAQALPLLASAGDSEGEANTLNKLGLAYYHSGDPKRSLEFFDQSLAVADSARDPRRAASAANNAGIIAINAGDAARAAAYLERALKIYRELAYLDGEVSALNNLAIAYGARGQFNRKIEYLRQALALRRTEGNKREESGILNNLGAAYKDLGDGARALELYEQSLSIAPADDAIHEAMVLINIGNVYTGRKEYDKAAEYLQRAYDIRSKAGDRRGTAAALLNLGALLTESERDESGALVKLQQALPIFREMGDRGREALALGNLAKVTSRLGDRPKARELALESLAVSRAIGQQESEIAALGLLTRLALIENDLSQARARAEEALGVIESLRNKVAGAAFRASLMSMVQDDYARYVDILMRLHRDQPQAGHDRAAFEAAERARARSLLDTLAEGGADIRQGVDPALLSREKDLERRIDQAGRRETALLAAPHTQEQAAAARRALDQLLTEYQELRAQVRQLSPAYASLTQPEPPKTAQIQAQLDSETLLLEYALGDERSYLWALTPDSITAFELPKESEIETLARRYFEFVSTPKADGAAATALSAELSKVLLGPVAALLPGKRLVVVANGALQYVPFAALPLPGDSLPLIANNEVISLPSASILGVLRSQRAARPSPPKTVAVLADPVFSPQDSRLARNAPAAASAARGAEEEQEPDLAKSVRAAGFNRLTRLRFTREEAQNILDLVPAGQKLRAVDFDATRAAVLSGDLANYRIIHIATHGIVNTQSPDLSGLVLSLVDAKGQRVDGFLRMHQLYNLNLPADLVVLSACQTALGREIHGEGLVGLTRGFMYAGASRVVASLWQVDDQATAELMKRFYRGMLGKQRLSPAVALRQAQTEMSRDSRYRSPYFWAAFTIQGDWR